MTVIRYMRVWYHTRMYRMTVMPRTGRGESDYRGLVGVERRSGPAHPPPVRGPYYFFVIDTRVRILSRAIPKPRRLSMYAVLPNLVDLAAADAETLTRQHTPPKSCPTKPTGVTHSLHPHWTPAQSKLPIFTPHFSLGHTILPDTSPFFKNGSIHVSCTVSGHVTIRPGECHCWP
jgi:hypothetical protein